MPDSPDKPKDPKKQPGQQQPPAPAAERRSWYKLAVVLALGLGLVGVGAWLALRRPSVPPKERLQQALQLVKETNSPSAWERAAKIATELKEIDYRDPDFAGALEFILGIASFRRAERAEGETESRESLYEQAVRYLREAERQALHESWRPQWAYALGVSLLRLGSAVEARPLLEEAVETYPEGRTEAAMLLAGIYLDSNERSELERALQLNDGVLRDGHLSAQQKDRAYLQRAQILQLLGREDEARQALAQVSQEKNRRYGSTLIQAQTLMAEGKYAEALQQLEPLATATMLDEQYVREALFRMAVCSEKLAQQATDVETRKRYIDAAIDFYERTAQRFPNSHECLAARLRVAELFRTYEPIPRTEEALEMYRRALRSVRSPDEYRNRWVTLEAFRQAVLRAWNDWVESHAYNEAIALARAMPPLFPREQAQELEARAYQHWAEYAEEQLQQAPADQRAALRREVRRRWRAAGRAFAQLAQSLRVTSRYPELVWTSAEQFYRGHDYPSAIRQYERLIAMRYRPYVPAAMVRKAECLMNLERFDAALQYFHRAMDEFPTDPAAFWAQYLVGQCLLEQGRLDDAEQAWRQVLSSDTLEPTAEEWRLSLLSLARLLYRRATLVMKPDQTAAGQQAASPSTQDPRLPVLDEAIARLDEYLQRYPKSKERVEAAYLLAEALTASAAILRSQRQLAETENARYELDQQINRRLSAALSHFRNLTSTLTTLRVSNQLDAFPARILRDSYFETARILVLLGRYEEAITAYRQATYKYPNDPAILLAYVQMAHCYDQLGQPAEALSLLEQARVILRDLPSEVFQSPATNLSAKDWTDWIDWSEKIHHFVQTRLAADSQPTSSPATTPATAASNSNPAGSVDAAAPLGRGQPSTAQR